MGKSATYGWMFAVKVLTLQMRGGFSDSVSTGGTSSVCNLMFFCSSILPWTESLDAILKPFFFFLLGGERTDL